MKYLFLVLGLIAGTAAMAQTNFFNFYIQGGGNNTDLHIVHTEKIEKINTGHGWQVLGGLQYNTHFGFFLYFNTGLRQQSYEIDSLSSDHPDTVQKSVYKPLFLDFPVGIGYKVPLMKNVSLKLYGGANVQVGVSGKLKTDDLFYMYDSSSGSTILTTKISNSRTLKYGRSTQKKYGFDLNSTNWGLQAGAGINFLNSYELNASFHYGTSNIFPGRDRNFEIAHYRMVEINFRYYFPSDYMSEKEKRRKGY
jgi:Outer membrane protein beta-barrel domain